MAKGYVIFTETEDRCARYTEKAVPTVLEAGGRPIVVHDDPEIPEGRWPGPRIVMPEFDSVEAARDWYHSPAYQAVIAERQSCADANAIIVSGFDMPDS
ncbi:MAG: DUF1330 domain-containing protein [Woeseia sp.]